MNITKYAVTGT